MLGVSCKTHMGYQTQVLYYNEKRSYPYPVWSRGDIRRGVPNRIVLGEVEKQILPTIAFCARGVGISIATIGATRIL